MNINADQTIGLLEDAVRERGADYIYPSINRGVGAPQCVYFEDNGAPSCLVGLVASKVGVTAGEIADEQGPVWEVSTITSRFDVESISILAEAQMLQDQRYTWGEALAAAHDRYDRVKGSHASNPND